ncbi:MAG: hypothetical protein HYT87_12350 [Nitrospirae bacterium]|nr:hypothetical protein [Nitrospirota bacterium]
MRLDDHTRIVLATILGLAVAHASPESATATPARSQSLLQNRGMADDTDLFIFPASIFLFDNAVYADLGVNSFNGAGGVLFHRHRGAGLFVNRHNVGRTSLGSTDDLTQTQLSLSESTQTPSIRTTTQSDLPPSPDKVLDLMLAKPLRGPGRWMGLGLSMSHKSDDRGAAAATLTDDTGLPITVTRSQKARSTLFAIMPGYTRITDSDRMEVSLNATLSLFRIENRLAQEIPPDVNVIPLGKSEGTALNQAGPPSVGGAFRWQTNRNPAATDWVFYTSLDRRDYDSVSPINETSTEADQYQFSVQTGPRWQPVENVTLTLLGEAGFDQLAVAPNPGPSRRVTTYIFPAVHGAAEARISKHISVRGAVVNGFEWTRSRLPGTQPESPRRTLSETETRFNWAVGLSGHHKAFDLDASVRSALLTNGPAFIGGETSQSGGPGLFSLLSLTYRFGEPAQTSTNDPPPPSSDSAPSPSP